MARVPLEARGRDDAPSEPRIFFFCDRKAGEPLGEVLRKARRTRVGGGVEALEVLSVLHLVCHQHLIHFLQRALALLVSAQN